MAQEIKLFGLTFKPMEENDYIGLAGADEGSFICYAEDDTYVLSPDQSSITQIDIEGCEIVWKAAAR